MKKRPTRKKRTKAERLLNTVRNSPSPKVNDPRQLDLTDYIVDARKREGFAKLDEAIEAELGKGGRR
jgi:hypothetical protein